MRTFFVHTCNHGDFLCAINEDILYMIHKDLLCTIHGASFRRTTNINTYSVLSQHDISPNSNTDVPY